MEINLLDFINNLNLSNKTLIAFIIIFILSIISFIVSFIAFDSYEKDYNKIINQHMVMKGHSQNIKTFGLLTGVTQNN